MAKGSFTDLLRGYETESEDSKGKKFAVRYITGSASRATQSRTARRISEAGAKIAEALNYTSTRAYGLFLLGFGLLTLLIQFAKDYLNIYDTIPMSSLIIGIIFSTLAVPFLAFDMPLAIAMQKFPLTEFIFFEFFCLQPAHRLADGKKPTVIPPYVGLILGFIPAIIGAFLPLWYIVAAIAGAVYLYLAYICPEFSFFFTFLLMPYLPLLGTLGDIILSALVTMTLVSYLRKVVSGKRIYFLEQYDLALLLMLVFVFITGVFVKGMESFTSSLVLIILSMGYVLTGSLVTNRRLADCVIKAVITSSVPISVCAVWEFFATIISSGLSAFSGVSITFNSPDMLAIFLLIVAVFSLYFVIIRRSLTAKLLYLGILSLTVFSMVLTLRVWVFVAALFGVLAYLALRMERGSGVVLAILSLLPYAVLFLPSEWLLAISGSHIVSALGLGDAIPVWINSRDMLLDNFFAGVGMGSESFATEYIKYSPLGTVETNSHSFLLQIICEAGVFALLAFIAIFVIRLVHRSIYIPYIKSSQVSLLNSFAAIAMVVLMVYGLFTSLWSDMTMYYLFWCVFGLGSGALRVSKQEFDDRVAYFSDGADVDASSIDISIR